MEQDPKKICSGHEVNSDAYISCIVRGYAFTAGHYCCSARMGGDNNPLAVLTPDLRVRGVESLRIVDLSVAPKIPLGHTNAHTVMIAERASDLIKVAYGRKPGVTPIYPLEYDTKI